MKKCILGLIVILLFAFLMTCENDYPPSLYDPDAQFNPNPAITAITPDWTWAGIGEFIITGENFSTVPGENHVYFNGAEGTVEEASATQLSVKAPNLVKDSIAVVLRVDGAILFASYDTPLVTKAAEKEYGGFDDYDNPNALACDLEENLYVSSNKDVFKVEPESLKEKFATLLAVGAASMKKGPGGDIYYVQAYAMFRVPAAGGSDTWYVIFQSDMNDLDFDQYGNIYCGGKAGILYRVDIATKTFTAVAEYPSYAIKSVRVFEDYVYVAASYSGTETPEVRVGVWRNHITSATEVDNTNELVVDWDAEGGGVAGSMINAITFSEAGELFMGVDKGEALYIRNLDGTIEPFFPEILHAPTKTLCWGNGEYMYVVRLADPNASPAVTRRVIRINMMREGARYYGREM